MIIVGCFYWILLISGWWLLIVGWWLMIDDWWLLVNVCWLLIDAYRLMNDDYWSFHLISIIDNLWLLAADCECWLLILIFWFLISNTRLLRNYIRLLIADMIVVYLMLIFYCRFLIVDCVDHWFLIDYC